MVEDAAPPVLSSLEEEGSLLRLTLNRPKGNILDTELIAAIRRALLECRAHPSLRTILFTAEGRHFSFGASVEEHQLDQVSSMLPAFHRMFYDLIDSERVLLVAVRGACLGGGLELAAFCNRVFATPSAKLGQPEVKLGVFAPVASLVLPIRCGRAHAEDLLLSGRTVDGQEALRMGLVDQLCDDPVEAALAWHREHLMPSSAAALRHVIQAARLEMRRRILGELPELERLYLDNLMATHDAREGVAAFLEKREPQWTHR